MAASISGQHITVLLGEAVDAVAPSAGLVDGNFVDGTFGRGGHSRALLARLSPAARLVAFDKDTEAVAAAQPLVHADRKSVV